MEKLFLPSQKGYLRNNIGFVETVVSRMVAPIPDIFREKQPLLVTVEPYNILPVAKKNFKGEVPGIKGFYPVENILPYEELKLFVHNLAHAALAYTGFLAGHTFIWECMENKRIFGILEGVMEETREAIIRKHDFDRQEVNDYIADLFSRFRNRALNDTVNRVGRDPLRKMGGNDRIAGAMKLCLRQNIFPENICFVMAACLCYNYPQDKTALQLQEILSGKGLDSTIRSVSLIDDRPVIERVEKIYKEIKSDSSYFKGA
jgi:mannitol-1-phosphate 5-dehydrogenase